MCSVFGMYALVQNKKSTNQSRIVSFIVPYTIHLVLPRVFFKVFFKILPLKIKELVFPLVEPWPQLSYIVV